MARIRYLHPEFFEDEDLSELPYWVRILFSGMWTIADKAGRLEDRPERIKIKVLPYDKVNIDKGLEILSQPKKHSKKPYIVRYVVDGERYIQIISWSQYQSPHHTEKDSVIPPYNGELTVKQPLDNSNLRDAHLCNKEKEKEKEKGVPALLEVKEHFTKNNSTEHEAQKFFNYYEANGWKVGANPMKKWRSAASGWILRCKDYGKPAIEGRRITA
jgi:hypothetical protein